MQNGIRDDKNDAKIKIYLKDIFSFTNNLKWNQYPVFFFDPLNEWKNVK